jgi:hypothetical protein
MKRKFALATGILLACVMLFSEQSVRAEETVQQSVEQVESRSVGKQPRTLILTAAGELRGSIAPYYDLYQIPGLETGFIDLHYRAHDTGFVDGDYSYLTIELPSEFATIAKQSNFKQCISGRVQRKGLLGDKWFNYSPDDIIVNGTQISFKNPRELWLIQGEIIADISIHYGKVQEKYPIRLIRDSREGSYVVRAALRRSMAPWDPIQYPILGSNTADWYSGETSAYWGCY